MKIWTDFFDELSKLDKSQTPEELYNLKEPYDSKKAYTPYIKSIEYLSDDNIVSQKLIVLLIGLHNINIYLGELQGISLCDNNDPYSVFKENSLKKMALFSQQTPSHKKLTNQSSSQASDIPKKLTSFEKFAGKAFQNSLKIGNPHGNSNFDKLLRDIFQMLFAAEYSRDHNAKPSYETITSQILATLLGKEHRSKRKIYPDATIYSDYPISIIGNLLFQIRQSWYYPVIYNNNHYPSVYKIDYLSTEIYKIAPKFQFEELDNFPNKYKEIVREFQSVFKLSASRDKKHCDKENCNKEYCERMYCINGIKKIYKHRYQQIKLLSSYMENLYNFLKHSPQFIDFSYYANFPKKKDFPEIYYFITLNQIYMGVLEHRAPKNYPLQFAQYPYEHPFIPVGKNWNKADSTFSNEHLSKGTKLSNTANHILKKKKRPSNNYSDEAQQLKQEFLDYTKMLSDIFPALLSLKYTEYLNVHCSKCPYIIEADKKKGRLMRCSLPFGCLSCEHHLGALDTLKDAIENIRNELDLHS